MLFSIVSICVAFLRSHLNWSLALGVSRTIATRSCNLFKCISYLGIVTIVKPI